MLGALPRTQNLCSRKPSTLSAPSLELEFVKLQKLNIKPESRIATRPGIPTPTSADLHRPVGLPRGCWRRTFRFLYQSKDEISRELRNIYTSLLPRHILLPVSSWGQGQATPQAAPQVVKGLCCWAQALLFLSGV